MKLSNIRLQEIIFASLFIVPLSASVTQVSVKDIENNQQDFINSYLKENQKKKRVTSGSSTRIEVGYSDSSQYKRRYIRGQRLRDANRELDKLREENKKLSIERERLELENEILQLSKSRKSKTKKKYKSSSKKYSTKKSHKTTKTTKRVKSKRYKRRYKRKKSYAKSRKIFIKVDSVSKRMKIYRGNKLLYNWKIRFKETLKTRKRYKRRGYSFMKSHKYNKKNKIYFKDGQATQKIRIVNGRSTLYSKIRLRQKYINRLNALIKRYGRRNVIIKIVR
jgi:hypothetical protein